MILEQCPHCWAKHVQTQSRFHEGLKDNVPELGNWHLVRCQNPSCKSLVLVITNTQGMVLKIFPSGEFKLASDVPVSAEIREDYNEAGSCLEAGCYKASMVMSRRALQRILKNQGCNQHRLVDAIDKALESNMLRKQFHDLATEIRHYGNLGAHPDDDQLVNATKESAGHILDFVRLVIHDLYEIPASADLLKTNRIAAKAAAVTET